MTQSFVMQQELNQWSGNKLIVQLIVQSKKEKIDNQFTWQSILTWCAAPAVQTAIKTIITTDAATTYTIQYCFTALPSFLFLFLQQSFLQDQFFLLRRFSLKILLLFSFFLLSLLEVLFEVSLVSLSDSAFEILKVAYKTVAANKETVCAFAFQGATGSLNFNHYLLFIQSSIIGLMDYFHSFYYVSDCKVLINQQCICRAKLHLKVQLDFTHIVLYFSTSLEQSDQFVGFLNVLAICFHESLLVPHLCYYYFK